MCLWWKKMLIGGLGANKHIWYTKIIIGLTYISLLNGGNLVGKVNMCFNRILWYEKFYQK